MSEGVDMSVCECEVLLGRIPGPVSYLIYAPSGVYFMDIFSLSSFKTFFFKEMQIRKFCFGCSPFSFGK